jgi:hypothetical protein
MWSEGLNGLRLAAILAGLASAGMARAEPLSGAALVEALRQGGYVLLMRHASSPLTPPAAGAAESDNPKQERQLDERGRIAAHEMGLAIKTLRIPVGDVLSSPTYRALETVRLASLPIPQVAVELGDGGASMRATTESQSTWLRSKVGEVPRAGTDTIIVTQYPNIMGAIGPAADGLSDGETLVFHPDGNGAEELVGRIKIETWSELERLKSE